MSVDLDKFEKQVDEILAKATKENLSKWLNEHRQKAVTREGKALPIYSVSQIVIYDNFARDWGEQNEKYQIMEVVKHGYLIGNEYTKPFFAYEYQIKTCG